MAGNKREVWIDNLKGLAILLVILGHVLSGYLDAGLYPEAYIGLSAVREIIYSFHMPLFFCISGFTFSLAYYRGGRFQSRHYRRQILNLLWIYILFEILQWCVKQLVPALVNETFDLTDLLHILWAPLGNYWYLYVLLVFYLAAGVSAFPRRSGWWLAALAALAVFAAGSSLEWTYLTVYRIFYHAFFFALGCLLPQHRRLLRSSRAFWAAAMVLAMAAFFQLAFSPSYWYPTWEVGIALAFSWVLLAAFFRHGESPIPILSTCGKYCLEIYLLHPFFTAGLRSVLAVLSPWASVLLNFLLSTGGCLALSALLRRVPAADFFFRPVRFLDRCRRK